MSAKLLGVTFCSNWRFDEHVENILTICSQHCYLLKFLKAQNLPATQLNVVFSAIVVSRIIYALPAWGRFLSNDLVAKLDVFFSKKLSAGATVVIWNVCLFYCMRQMNTYFVKWFIIRITVFTSYYLRKRFYPWNSEPPIVFLLCLSVTITYTNVCLYCDICLVMHIRFCMKICCSSTVFHFVSFYFSYRYCTDFAMLFCFAMAFDWRLIKDYLFTYKHIE